MRITIATGPMFPVPPLIGGAVPKIWQGLAEAFVARGHEVTIMARADARQAASESLNGVEYRRWGGYNQGRWIYVDLARDLAYALGLRRRLPPADILVTNDFWLPIFAAKSPRSGRVVVNCGRFPKNQYGLYRQASRLAAVSSAVGTAIAEQTPSVADKISVLPNPVDTRLFSPPIQRSEQALKKMLYVGRIHPEKGLLLLIDAFKRIAGQHPDATLQIVGPHDTTQGGGGSKFLRDLKIAANGFQIEFPGPIFQNDKLVQTYHEAGVFCYPSLAEEGEAFGVAPLEAMATGLMPVVSKLACFSDFIYDGVNGRDFDHRQSNPDVALANVLCDVFDRPRLIQELGAAAAVTAASYDFMTVADRYLHEFVTLLHEPRSSN
ncbi:MAG: glycosyltransferase family 4 protein [Nitrospira sp.]